MIPRSSGESMSNLIKMLSNNVFDDFINRVDYFQGNVDCGDLYLAHVNNFVTTSNNLFNDSLILYKIKGKENITVSADKYYKTIKKYLNPNLPILLVGTDPETEEMGIIQ